MKKVAIIPILKPKVLQEQGFTLVEVLVAILISTIFVSVAMQMMAITAVFRFQAKQFTEATTWVQADLENVKSKAAQLPSVSTTLTDNAVANQSEITVASVIGLQVGDRLQVGTDSTNNVIQSLDATTLTITLKANLGTTQLIGATVAPRCSADTSTDGFAQYLQQNLPTLSNNGIKTIAGINYVLSRTANIKNAVPYDVLELSYSVTPQDSSNATEILYSEVSPNAAFRCSTS